ncbi:MAG: GDSL-type esterase/lipase family protein [Bryobacteraceae bacterium]
MIPVKTMLAAGTFVGLMLLPLAVPELAAYKSVDAGSVAKVWDMPLPVLADGEGFPSLDRLRAERAQALASQILVDPKRQLDHFYDSLLRGGMVRVIHYGDSPTTADLITADVRGMLQKQFGDAGAGYVLIARPWAWYNHRGMAMSSENWGIDVAGRPEFKDGMFGLGGGRFRGAPGSVANWTVKSGQAHSAEVAYQAQPGGGSFAFEADGRELGVIDTASDQARSGFATFELPPRASQMRVRVTQGAVQLYGVEFRKDRVGVLYSSLGVNGASVTMLSRAFNKAQLTGQLAHYRPDLVVLAYGTNESGFPGFVDTTWVGEMDIAVKRVRAALPEASILLMSPMDRGELKSDGTIGTIEALPRLVTKEKQLAADLGVGFFNTFEAMGGKGTMAKWYAAQPRLVGADYIHPLPAGAKIVGELLYDSLRDGYSEYKIRKLKAQEDNDRKLEVARREKLRQRASASVKAGPVAQ